MKLKKSKKKEVSDMTKQIKVGVIGVGQMGQYHAEIYQKLPQVELVAICEYNDERRAEWQKNFSVKHTKTTTNF